MLRKIIPLVLCGVLFGSSTQAQEFELMHQPMTDTVSGATSPVSMYNYVINQTGNSLQISWKYNSDISSIPQTWAVSDICDNNTCYVSNLESYKTFTLAPYDTGMLKPDIYAPTSGTGILKVEVNTNNQKDTAIFILTNLHGTSISALRLLDDSRVSLYPNPLPSGHDLKIYVDKNLNATEAVVYNIIGQRQMAVSLNKGSEVHMVNTGNLPAGMYFVKVMDHSGSVIASRKFAKQ